ncbi:MAG: magnesium/cobalt transporter CorA [Chitinophagaceae bacterium]|nr:magnesium/cobalt transporter CorA [Chitinophagaceae bacterium]
MSIRNNYLKYLNPLELLQTKKVLKSNPNVLKTDKPETESVISLYTYNRENCISQTRLKTDEVNVERFEREKNYWLNLDILNKKSVEVVGNNIGLDALIIEDILSVHQRPKVDEFQNYFTCVLQMLYYNANFHSIESEQVSFVLGKNFLFTFQDDSHRDQFDTVRERLTNPVTKIRQFGSDYLLYALLDIIVDNYFEVLEKLGEQIEKLEEEITRNKADSYTMNRINNLRKELIFFKRNTSPVRELINNIIRSDHVYIQDANNKYFKDINDHVVQIIELTESYRDVIMNIRDLYLNQTNLKLNEVMKFLAIVTTLLAPATVIGGIFGMNFDRIPYLHDQNGFWIATVLMLIVPVLMLFYFRKKGWF